MTTTANDRFSNIQALIDRSTRDLSKVEEHYNRSLHEKQIGAELKIDIKNLCENLRSVLDYLAREVRSKCTSSLAPGDKLYFPISDNRSSFEGQMRKSYLDLDRTNRPLWDFLESIQPYKSEATQWLGYFNKVNNENKHNDLVEQTRSETQEVRVHMQGGGMVSWRGNVRFSGDVRVGGVPIDPLTQLPVPHPSQRVERTTWVDFRFVGMEISAIGLLRASVTGIKRIAADIQKLL